MLKSLVFIILFIVLALAVVFLTHYFVYISVVKFFRLEAPWLKRLLSFLLAILPLSYILASVISRYLDNPLIRKFYFFSGLWLGLATTLIAFFLFAWLIYGASRFLSWPLEPSGLGALAIVLAIIYSGYGVYNAFHPRLKEISVNLKNLPLEWQGKRVVQISDVHLGQVLSEDFLNQIIEKVNAQEPAAVFITGDIFDGMGDNFEYIAPALDRLKAEKGVYFVTGNHETYFGLEKVYNFLAKSKVKVFRDDMVEVDGLQIIGLNYPERFNDKDVGQILSGLADFKTNKPSILLYHTPYHPEAAQAAGISLQLSGHTHRGQIFPLGYITKLIYGGYDYGLHQRGDFNIYTTSGVGVWGPTMRTGTPAEIVSITLK